MSTQQQLFDAGPVKMRTGRWAKRRHEQREYRARLIARLQGSGLYRRDPISGNWYMVDGRHSVKRAYLVRCETCDESCSRSRKQLKRANGRAFCSRDCFHSRPIEGLPDGTRRSAKDGYTKIKIAGEWILEHRHVIQEQLGRPLTSTETVHHVNGDRADNRPENLQLRRGQHGAGQSHVCADCGSVNVVAVRIAEGAVGS